MHEVCPADFAKKRRQRKYRLRKQAAANPGKPWYVRCQQCSRPIKQSQKRMFCEGGECRKAFEAKLQESRVERVIPIKHKASSRSETLVFIPGFQPSRVPPRNSHGYPVRWHKIEGRSTTLSVLFPYDEPLFARACAETTEPLGDFLARIDNRSMIELKAPRLRLNLISNFGRLKFTGKYHRPNRRAEVKIDPASSGDYQEKKRRVVGGAA
jgi:hypothetical protein